MSTKITRGAIKYVMGPNGEPIYLADLPDPKTSRWVARKKARIVCAVRGGLVEKEVALARYSLSEAEWAQWLADYSEGGVEGMKIKHLEE